MSIDQALFRQVSGSFASGVTVVTTGVDGTYHGMTASAFASLSLEPTQVLVCVDRSSHTFPLLQACGLFNVNILSAGQEQISRLFASEDAPERHSLAGIDFHLGRLGAPLLSGDLGHFECRVLQQYDGGDHVIFAGEVEYAALSDAREPLLYYRGRYRHLANEE